MFVICKADQNHRLWRKGCRKPDITEQLEQIMFIPEKKWVERFPEYIRWISVIPVSLISYMVGFTTTCLIYMTFATTGPMLGYFLYCKGFLSSSQIDVIIIYTSNIILLLAYILPAMTFYLVGAYLIPRPAPIVRIIFVVFASGLISIVLNVLIKTVDYYIIVNMSPLMLNYRISVFVTILCVVLSYTFQRVLGQGEGRK
jgi:hypothetical protein